MMGETAEDLQAQVSLNILDILTLALTSFAH